MNKNAMNVELAQSCLSRIRDIAARGACSEDPEHIGYALQELTQALFERTGSEERLFEPMRADRIQNLDQLHCELEFIDSSSQDMRAFGHHCSLDRRWMHRLGFEFCQCGATRNSPAKSLPGIWS